MNRTKKSLGKCANEITLEDGTKQCQQCADCPRKEHTEDQVFAPKMNIEMDVKEVQEEVKKMSLKEVDFTKMF